MADESTSIHSLARFDLGTPQDDGEWVRYQNSLLFRAGDYPAKDFSMTPAELRAAVEKFDGPVENELEHFKTLGYNFVIDGHLGCVESVRLSEDSTELYGTVKVPRWLDKVWDRYLEVSGGHAKQVSCVWNRSPKTLRRLGLTTRGHVPDAALMSAFAEAKPAEALAAFAAAHKTPHGQNHMQAIHDMTAGVGAVCSADNSARFVSARERSGIQAIHDLTTKHGAMCSVSSMSDSPPPEHKPMSLKDKFLAMFKGNPSPPDDAAVDDFLVTLSAAVPPVKEEKEVEKVAPVPVPVASFADSPEGKAMAKEIADLKRTNLLKDIAADAAAFADGEVREGRAVPSERANLVALFTQSALDDADHGGSVSFSDGSAVKAGTRVDALKAVCSTRPRHALFGMGLSEDDLPANARVLAAFGKKPAGPDEDAVNAYLSHTDVGQAAVARKQANGRN